MDLVSLEPLQHDILPKLKKLSSASPAETSLWRFSMPGRLASTPSMIVPSSHLNACASSVSFTSSQPSHVAAESRLSSRPLHVMLLRKEALQCADVDLLAPLRHESLPKLQKLSAVCPVKTSLWPLFKPTMLSRQAARPSKSPASSHLRACASSLSYTLQPQVSQGAPLSRRLPSVMLCEDTLQRVSIHLASLKPLHHKTLRKLQRPSRWSTLWLAQILGPLDHVTLSKLPWVFSDCNMPSRPATCPSKVPSTSQLHAGASSLSCTSAQHSHVARGCLLSSRPSHLMLLHKVSLQRAGASLGPLHHVTLSKLQLSCSFLGWTARTLPKRTMLSRQAACLCRIFPSSQLRACPSSLSYTTLQPSQVARGSLRSSWPPHVMLLRSEALEVGYCINCMDLAILDAFQHETLRKLPSLSCSFSVWPAQTTPSLLSKQNTPLRLALRPSEIVGSSDLRACASNIYTSSGASGAEGQGGRVGSMRWFCCLVGIST